MTLRLSADEDRALELLAQTQGVTKREAAVRAIVSAAARTLRNEQVAELARQHLADYRDAERRLKK